MWLVDVRQQVALDEIQEKQGMAARELDWACVASVPRHIGRESM